MALRHPELTLLGPQLGDVDVQVADGVALELGPLGLVALHVRQAADVVALEQPMQCGPTEMRDESLKRIEAVVERQQRMAAESDAHGLLLGAENR